MTLQSTILANQYSAHQWQNPQQNSSIKKTKFGETLFAQQALVQMCVVVVVFFNYVLNTQK